MPRRGWLALALLAPFALVAIGMQVAALLGAVGVGQLALGARSRDSATVTQGAVTLQRAARALDLTWSSPPARLLGLNPITLGAVDDLRASAHAVAQASGALAPLAELGTQVLGFDGEPPMISGTTIDIARVDDLAEPVTALHDALIDTQTALDEVPGTGLLGRPIGAIAESLGGLVADLGLLAGAADTAMPDLARALGSEEPQRYLVCALNDAELFGSGGAPLFAVLIEAVEGTISMPISGQMESKLSPDNPPIVWEHVGGPPWYREDEEYPFVNSNFHPDFRTAAQDMSRAWAALGYPEVEGVITIDVNALANILAWVGPIDSGGHGVLDHTTLIPTVLVDAYREFDSPEGVAERHARNDQLVDALLGTLTRPQNILPALRGTMDSIPPRHLQAAFDSVQLEGAVELIGAQGALAWGSGDLIGVFSQSSPNKLSVFQERRIRQDVQLQEDGGAQVRRTVTLTNAVPDGAEGDPTTWAGYSALIARLRAAHRVPTGAQGLDLSTADPTALVPDDRTGPFPDERGGKVMWQGHEIPPGGSVTVEVSYRLPAGTFPPGTYSVSADPQALTTVARLDLAVRPAPGDPVPTGVGWAEAEGAAVWSGTLDRPLLLQVG